MVVGKEVVIDYEFLRGRQNEMVVKERFVAIFAAAETFRFKRPYKMSDHGSSENGLNWADGHMEYEEMHTVFTEAVGGFAHLYAYGVFNCTFLGGLTGRPIHKIEGLGFPHPSLSITNAVVLCHVRSFPDSFAQTKQRNPSTIG